jgi:N-acetyltransferase 10
LNPQEAAGAGMRKKVDERIRTLIENGVRERHRSLFVIVGDKSRDQIVNLNYMLAKSRVKSRPSVLWCYRDKLEISRCVVLPLMQVLVV